MSIPTKREQGDIRLIDNLVGFCGDMETEDAWNRVKADIATRELAIAERDAALARVKLAEAERDEAVKVEEALCLEATLLQIGAKKLEQERDAALARAEAAEAQVGRLREANDSLCELVERGAPPPDRGALAARIVDGVKPSPEIDGHNPTEDQWRVIYRYRELVGQGVDFTGAATRARVEFVERVLAEAGGGGTGGPDTAP